MKWKVLIADDEPAVAASLQKQVAWEKLGLEVTATAMDGEETLRTLQETPVDIVITDIRMPALSGLELCRQLYETDPHIQLIIISGYAEFSYAQRAIKYGCVGYCLKPIEYDELEGYLRTAVRNLSRGPQELLYDDFLDAMQSGETARLNTYMQQFGFVLPQYHVAVAVGTAPPHETDNRCLSFYTADRTHVLICEKSFRAETIREFAENPLNSCLGYVEQPCALEDIRKSIAKCQDYAYSFFFDHSRKVCCRDYDQKAGEYLDEIHRAIVFSNKDALLASLKKLGSGEDVKALNIWSLMRICNTIFTSGIFPLEAEDYYIYSYHDILQKYSDAHTLIDTLCALLTTEGVLQADEVSNAAFLGLIKFMGKSYAQDLSLNSVSKDLHMNPNYLGKVFKREMGMSFTKYLTDLRIQKAREYLLEGGISISDIAMKVGFNDYFYFLRIFKKVTGQTPSQFKNAHAGMTPEMY